MMTLDSPHGRFLKVILALGIVYPVLLPVAYFSKLAPRGEFAALAGLLLLITLSVCALILITKRMSGRLVVGLGVLGYTLTFIMILTFVKKTDARLERLKHFEQTPPP